jgi:hypothetical protein
MSKHTLYTKIYNKAAFVWKENCRNGRAVFEFTFYTSFEFQNVVISVGEVSNLQTKETNLHIN